MLMQISFWIERFLVHWSICEDTSMKMFPHVLKARRQRFSMNKVINKLWLVVKKYIIRKRESWKCSKHSHIDICLCFCLLQCTHKRRAGWLCQILYCYGILSHHEPRIDVAKNLELWAQMIFTLHIVIERDCVIVTRSITPSTWTCRQNLTSFPEEFLVVCFFVFVLF